MLTHIITINFFQYSEHLLGVETLIVVPKGNLINSAVAGNRSISMVSASFIRQEAEVWERLRDYKESTDGVEKVKTGGWSNLEVSHPRIPVQCA